MSLVSRLTTAAHHYWQQLPKESITALAFLGGAILGIQVSSNHRIRAAIILGSATLWLVTTRIQRLLQPAHNANVPIKNLLPDLISSPAKISFYQDLLPPDVLGILAQYYTFEDKQRILAKKDPELNWEAKFQEALRKRSQAQEDESRKTLEDLGIEFYPDFGDSAVEQLRRHRTVTSPKSLLLQEKQRLNAEGLQVDKMLGVRGPVLITKYLDRIVLTHWPTGKKLYELPDDGLPFTQLKEESLLSNITTNKIMSFDPDSIEFNRIGSCGVIHESGSGNCLGIYYRTEKGSVFHWINYLPAQFWRAYTKFADPIAAYNSYVLLQLRDEDRVVLDYIVIDLAEASILKAV